MKKVLGWLLVLMLAFTVCGCGVSEKSEAVSEERLEAETSGEVYRTETGEKYHLEECICLKNGFKITIEEAKELGLEPCKVCMPPQ